MADSPRIFASTWGALLVMQFRRLVALTMVFGICGSMRVGAQDIPPPPPGDALTAPSDAPATEPLNEDFDIQTRGPIHEAFSEQYQANPTPGLLITKRPPAAIEELPPNIKPEGPDVIWIPGYWAWDDENEDFMWISGIWRRPPPGHQWAPGYWATVDGGWRWVSGFWAREAENIVYREPPPESQDHQPAVDSVQNDQFWIPGSWQWQDGQYAWSNGYYAPCQENWVWVPVRWRWTPRGYIRLAGYWDFRPTVRAMLFAPVVFRPGVLLRPRFVFTPRVVVNPWIALNHFWIRPGYGHYYFGNYYAANYGRWGFHPYANYFRHAGNWDPIFCYYQGFYRRQGIDFHARINSWNTYYHAHADVRPPLNWKAQQEFSRHHRGSDVLQTSIITSPIADFAAGAKARLPLVTIDDRVRLSIGQADARVNKQLLAHRELAERTKLDAANPGKASDLVKWTMPKEALPKDIIDLRRSGTPIGDIAKREIDLKPVQRRPAETPRVLDTASRETEKIQSRVDAAEAARKAALKADRDQIRQRFGNDPIRFQQEMDRLNGRRIGEQPSITTRNKPLAPHGDPGSSLQGSGRTGGLGSPDFRLLPRNSSGTSMPGSGNGSIDQKRTSMIPSNSLSTKSLSTKGNNPIAGTIRGGNSPAAITPFKGDGAVNQIRNGNIGPRLGQGSTGNRTIGNSAIGGGPIIGNGPGQSGNIAPRLGQGSPGNGAKGNSPIGNGAGRNGNGGGRIGRK
jgi:hypothetical protein